MLSNFFSLPNVLLILAIRRPTCAEATNPPTLITLDDLQPVETVPQNIALLLMVLNTSQIYEVGPPIQLGDDATKNASEDYVILPQINGNGNGSAPHFPYFVRITLLRMGSEGTNSELPNDDLSLGPFTKPKTSEERKDDGENDSSHSHSPSPTPNGGRVVLSPHLIHILTVVLYVFFGLGLLLFILHNFVTCISIAIWGKDRVEQLPTRVRSSFQRRVNYGSNSFYGDKHPFYEPL